jgi:hypothetical protein
MTLGPAIVVTTWPDSLDEAMMVAVAERPDLVDALLASASFRKGSILM